MSVMVRCPQTFGHIMHNILKHSNTWKSANKKSFPFFNTTSHFVLVCSDDTQSLFLHLLNSDYLPPWEVSRNLLQLSSNLLHGLTAGLHNGPLLLHASEYNDITGLASLTSYVHFTNAIVWLYNSNMILNNITVCLAWLGQKLLSASG